MKQLKLKCLTIFTVIMIAATQHVARAQSDTAKVLKSDTTTSAFIDNTITPPADTLPVAKADTLMPVRWDTVYRYVHDTIYQSKGTIYLYIHDTLYQSKDKGKRRKDEFIVYGGGSANYIDVSSSQYESTPYIGYHLGGAYKRGRFFYWQAGARFNFAQYQLRNMNNPSDTGQILPVSDIDLPITAGVNLLAPVNRIVGLRLFVSVVPSFMLGVGDNTLGIKKENVNSFMTYGQAGAGLNIAFFLVEAGFNYGFKDLFKYDVQSRPGQLFINLGFRF